MMRVMVSLQFILLASLLFLVAMTVVESQQTANLWYKRSSICALKGSTVTMGFTYVFNLDNEPQRVYWGKDDVTGYKLPDLALEPQYSDRVQYVREGTQDWTLSLSNVMGEDQGTYHAVVVTMSGRFPGSGGVILTVSDLWVERIRGRLVEGDEVTLTCKTSCNLTETPLFIWNKDGSFFSSSNPLHLLSVSWQDAGSYSCSVRGKSYLSSAVNLNVQYPPKRVSVSISPSGDIVEDSSVTLTCSSDANPPVQSYTWYKGEVPLITGKTYAIRRTSSKDSGEYKCKSRNQYGEKFSKVTLNVLYPPKKVSISEIVEGSSVTLTCSSDANPPVHRYTWYKVNESSPVGSGQSNSFTLTSSSSGWFYCVAQNIYGSQRAPAVGLMLNASLSSGHSSSFKVLYVAVCVGVGVGLGVCIGAVIASFYCVRRKRQKRKVVNEEVPRADDNTYVSLDPMTRSSNDVYSTVSALQPRRPDDTYVALGPRYVSDDYDTLTTVRKHC